MKLCGEIYLLFFAFLLCLELLHSTEDTVVDLRRQTWPTQSLGGAGVRCTGRWVRPGDVDVDRVAGPWAIVLKVLDTRLVKSCGGSPPSAYYGLGALASLKDCTYCCTHGGVSA